MSTYKLQFKLKQHTPIIHFQHDQHGATLRATELKPKLDKFLIEKLKLTEIIKDNNGEDKEVPKEEYKNWFINKGKEHLALDYKVRVNSNNNLTTYLPFPLYHNNEKQKLIRDFLGDIFDDFLKPAPYFANADKIKFGKNNNKYYLKRDECKPKELNYAILNKNDVNCYITSFNTKTLDAVKENIIEFFLINNFGTRQNKGFGSYTVVSINNEKVSDGTINKLLKTNFIKKSNKQDNIKKVFSFILEEYQLLKSGINIPFGRNPVYKKSELFKYFINKNIRWEKRFIKQKLNQNGVILTKRHDPIDYDESKVPRNVNHDRNYYNAYNDKDGQNNNYKYIRALLGLAENFEFAIDNKGRLKVKVKSVDGSVERFKSPLFFKVIENTVYLKTDQTYKNIEEKKFQFLYDGNLGTLEVPASFDLNKFINTHISNKWQNV